jgi:hypothetical protein
MRGADCRDAGFFDASVFESNKRAGEETLKRLLNEALDGTSVTVVLISSQTAFGSIIISYVHEIRY